MNLEYQKLLQEYPGLAKALDALPGRLFSGKEHPKPAHELSSSVMRCRHRRLFFTTARSPTTSRGPRWRRDAMVSLRYRDWSN